MEMNSVVVERPMEDVKPSPKQRSCMKMFVESYWEEVRDCEMGGVRVMYVLLYVLLFSYVGSGHEALNTKL